MPSSMKTCDDIQLKISYNTEDNVWEIIVVIQIITSDCNFN